MQFIPAICTPQDSKATTNWIVVSRPPPACFLSYRLKFLLLHSVSIKTIISMMSSHFRNYLWSVPCALDLEGLVLSYSTAVYCTSCSVAHVFCWNSGSDHCHTCELLIFIIQLVLRLLYCVCQLSIIGLYACMSRYGLPHLVIMNNEY